MEPTVQIIEKLIAAGHSSFRAAGFLEAARRGDERARAAITAATGGEA